MKRAMTVLAGLVLLAFSLFVFFNPWLPLIAVLLARWDKEETFDQHHAVATRRGDVPRWLRWLQTLDDRLPGGTYEPTVASLLQRTGRYVTSFYWIWLRNRGHGLRRLFARPSTEAAYFTRFPADEKGRVDGVRDDGSWYWERRVGPFKAVAGYRIYPVPGEGYLAIPTATIKRD